MAGRKKVISAAGVLVVAVLYFVFWFDPWANVQFADEVQSIDISDVTINELKFTDLAGTEKDLTEYVDKKNVVVVFTRGYSGFICPYCSSHASRLISRYSEFVSRDSEVIVIFPVKTTVDRERGKDFINAVKKRVDKPFDSFPFPLLFDVNLGSVKQLGIVEDLSKPATYILDKQGHIRFAYVGMSKSDRPSVKAMLDQLDEINAEQNPASESPAESQPKNQDTPATEPNAPQPVDGGRPAQTQDSSNDGKSPGEQTK